MHPSPPAQPAQRRLVIFGCGYVGTAVALHARLVCGWDVMALTRNADRAAALRSAGIEVVIDDLGSSTWHAAMPRDADFILNSVSAGGGGVAGYRHSYVDGMRSVRKWAEGGVPATLVYTSSTSVYPEAAGAFVDEDAVVGDGSETVRALLDAETLVRTSEAFARRFVLRLSGIYGPGRHYLLDQLRAGTSIFAGSGKHRLNLIHRDDIVTAVFACFAADRGVPGGVFNVTSDSTATKHEVVAWLAEQLGVACPVFAAEAGIPDPPGTVRRSGRVADRVISNRRFRTTFEWVPRLGDFVTGYRQILGEKRAG